MKPKMIDIVTKFLAEMTGVTTVVFFGCMGCTNHPDQPTGLIYHAFTFAMAIMAMIHIFDCVSGAHFNPAITVSAIINKKITPTMAVVYMAGQLLGGFIGYGLLKLAIPQSYMPGSFCVTKVNPELSFVQGTMIEAFATGVLIVVICGVWDHRNAGALSTLTLKIGFAILSLALATGHWTGCSLNPARSFGPALWNQDFEGHWVYWIGPMCGGAAGGSLYRYVFYREPVVERREVPLEELTALKG
ncbi:hypothetical protein ACFFRR_008357 [Megaselia abdita]